MSLAAVAIAQAYLPERQYYWYVRCKLASDPLYAEETVALRDTEAPLLDLGCGIGLLAHALRAQGYTGTYVGIDNDIGKIAAAQAAAARGSARHKLPLRRLGARMFSTASRQRSPPRCAAVRAGANGR